MLERVCSLDWREVRAICAASRRLETPSLARIEDTWWSTVFGEITRRSAI